MRTLQAVAAGFIAAALLAGTASAATFLTPAVPSTPGVQTVAEMEMTVSSTYANLREKPTTSSKLLGKLDKGTKVEVIKKGPKWTQVKVNNMEGYVATKLLM